MKPCKLCNAHSTALKEEVALRHKAEDKVTNLKRERERLEYQLSCAKRETTFKNIISMYDRYTCVSARLAKINDEACLIVGTGTTLLHNHPYIKAIVKIDGYKKGRIVTLYEADVRTITVFGITAFG